VDEYAVIRDYRLPLAYQHFYLSDLATICSGVNVFFGTFRFLSVLNSIFETGTEIPGQIRCSYGAPAAAEVGSLVYFSTSDEAGAITGPAFSMDDGTLA
jgi:hypothetical protein